MKVSSFNKRSSQIQCVELCSFNVLNIIRKKHICVKHCATTWTTFTDQELIKVWGFFACKKREESEDKRKSY